TAPSTGQFVFDTHGAPFNTVLCIGTRSSAVSGQGYDLGQNDNVSGSDLTSKVQISVTSGTQIAIRVSGVNDASHPSTGPFTLSWGPAADTTAPTVSITAPAAGASYPLNASVTVSATASDAGS